MARRRCLFDMRPDETIEGIQMSDAALSEEAVLRRVREMVDGKMKSGGLTHIVMRPVAGVSLPGKSRTAAAPEPSLFLIISHSLMRVHRSYRG